MGFHGSPNLAHRDLWVEVCGLTDLGCMGSFMTWNNRHQGNQNIQERLNRFFANTEWKDLFPSASVDHFKFMFSDHRLILLRFYSSSRVNYL